MRCHRAALSGMVLIGCCFIVPEAVACECYNSGASAPSLDPYRVIFAGTVVSAKEIEVPPTEGHSFKLVAFVVDRVWKGPRATVQGVYTRFGGKACGFAFEVGKRYVVTARVADALERDLFSSLDGTAFTDTCTLTAAADASSALIERLNRELNGWTPRWAKRAAQQGLAPVEVAPAEGARPRR
jgi:hypothetical protein